MQHPKSIKIALALGEIARIKSNKPHTPRTRAMENKLIKAALRLPKACDPGQFAAHLLAARTLYREYPELVTAKEMPEPLARALRELGYSTTATCDEY